MYQVVCEKYYKLYDAVKDEIINYFYSDSELIDFITYHYLDDYNPFLKQCVCSKNELFQLYKKYILYDNFNRIINIHDFEEKALSLYQRWQEEEKTSTSSWSLIKRKWRIKQSVSRKYAFLKKMSLNYRYRKDPVPHTRKWRGGSFISPPHTAKIIRMYKNPEYKGFNRGSIDEIPQWWDDRKRCVQRSWKEQSKARHQWQRGKI